MTGVKRSSSNHGHSKSSTKRSYLSEGQSSITHTGSPVNPMTAKALASKLNERNNMLNGAKKASGNGTTPNNGTASNNGTANDIPVPPLISIQTTPNRFKDGDDSGQQQRKISPTKKITTDVHSKSTNDGKHHKTEKPNKQSNGINTVHHSKTVKIRFI